MTNNRWRLKESRGWRARAFRRQNNQRAKKNPSWLRHLDCKLRGKLLSNIGPRNRHVRSRAAALRTGRSLSRPRGAGRAGAAQCRSAQQGYGRMCDHCRSWFPRSQVRKCLLFDQECFLFCERGTRTTRREVTQADNRCSISSLCRPCCQAWKANRVKCVMDDHRPGPFTMVAADLCDIEGLH